MESDGPWWMVIVIAAAVTVVLGAVLVSVVAAVTLGVGWIRRRLGHGPGDTNA
ncbi:hypothetical protein [Streptomyces brevispora]|uniref:Uncharacterized protein n=1 Tax=Streptomyces brevispora TaxID=887462 RepID=A0ABZ1G3C9_9ACTN|nr:hypothetical protein [Streptomyces brevispora]WSC14016.1 hypothetical protein OIE64_14945 [Streptomyces brevispora]